MASRSKSLRQCVPPCRHFLTAEESDELFIICLSPEHADADLDVPTVTNFKLSVDKLMTDHVLGSVSFVLEYNMYDRDDIHRPSITVASCLAQSSEGLHSFL